MACEALTWLSPALWLLGLTAAGLVPLTCGADFYFKASNSRGRLRTVHRNNATDRVAVHLCEGESIQLTFCLRQKTVIHVKRLVYSNDGPGESMALAVDQTWLGAVRTHNRSDRGRLWDRFISSPPLSSSHALAPGYRTLRVGVLGPSDGVEIDGVGVWLSDEGLTQNYVDCLVQCRESLPDAGGNAGLLWGRPAITQASYPTKCAEEDNVKIPIYLDGVRRYSVTATMPTYLSFANHRVNNDTDCPHLPPLLWHFSALPKGVNNFTAAQGNANLWLYGSWGFRVEFTLQGRSRGHVDAEMGSILTVRMQAAFPSRVKGFYIGRGGVHFLKERAILSGERVLTFNFSDYSWRENATNAIQLQFLTQNPVHVKEISLERRPMTGETVRKLYDAKGVVVEGVTVDFWWRRPETMKLKNGETGETFADIDFFRISLKVPWAAHQHYGQVLVMYQDGNARLLPLPPPGLDWIPFGSSLIVGHSDPTHLRPCAPITQVTFYPSTLQLKVLYAGRDSARMDLSADKASTKLIVQVESDQKPITGSKRGLPFATFRSMFIHDGYSDCDSVLVDGKQRHPVMASWGALQGKSFFFYRRCESRHLTLSPDLRLDVIEDSYEGELTSASFWWQLYSQTLSQSAIP